jgi:hypothetical protein
MREPAVKPNPMTLERFLENLKTGG